MGLEQRRFEATVMIQTCPDEIFLDSLPRAEPPKFDREDLQGNYPYRRLFNEEKEDSYCG
jgi:hypothetical protein